MFLSEYISKGYCHICGDEDSTKIGIWRPHKTTMNGWFNYLFKKQKEYDVPLCDECHRKIWQDIRRKEIVGVRL